MLKTVITADLPHPPSFDFTGYTVLTPHKGAAERLGVPHRSLMQAALRLLKSNGYEVASFGAAFETLLNVIGDLFPEIDAAASLAASIRLTLQTVLRTGIDLAKLEEYGSPRVKRLARIAEEYQFILRKKGLVDAEEVLWQASLLPIKPRKLLVYGYHRARFEEINLLQKLAGSESLVYLPEGASSIFKTNSFEIEKLAKAGWVINKKSIEPTKTAVSPSPVGCQLAQTFTGQTNLIAADEIEALEYPNIEMEVRGTLARVKSLILAGVPPKEIVLAARDASIYGAAVLAVAWEYGMAVQLMYSVALNETRFGAWMKLLLECLDKDFPFDQTVRLLFHPLSPNLPDNLWEKIKKEQPNNLADWNKLGVGLDALGWAESQSRRNWMRQLLSSLQGLGIRKKIGIWARELIAFQKFQDEISRIEENLDVEISRAQFINEISLMMAFINAPFHPAAGGIEFHEPHTLLGASYQHIFVLGMAEGVLPGPVSDNPVVDFYERRRLAEHGILFEDAAAVTRWEALSFYFLLMAAAEKIYFSFPRLIDNAEQLPSAYLARLGIKIKKAADQAKIVSSPEEARRVLARHAIADDSDQLMPAIKHAFNIEQLRESAQPHDEYDGVIGIPLDPYAHIWSASQLTTLGQCAFKWYASKVLRLEAAKAVEQELTALTRGKLYHKALELALKKAVGKENPRQIAFENLEEAFRQAESDPEIAAIGLPAWVAQRIEHLQILRAAIAAADFLRTGAVIRYLEKSFEGTWNGLKIRGQVDRIDWLPEGAVSVVDYKTGGSVPGGVKDDEQKAKIDIQIPIYLESAVPAIFAETAPETPVAAAGTYYSISKAKVLKRIDPSQIEAAHGFAEKVKKHLQDGHYPVAPDTDETACRYCDYELVCRKGYRLSRKRSQ